MGKNETSYEVTHDTVMTPRYLLEPIIAGLGPIGLDPCSNPNSVVQSALAILLHSYHPQKVPGAARTIYGNGLKHRWDGHGLVWCNPPYSDLAPWGEKMRDEGDELAALLPLRTGNVFWGPTFGTAAVECRLLRVTHEGEKTHAPFHQGLLYWGDRARLAAEVLESIGGPGSVRLHPRLTRPVWSFPVNTLPPPASEPV